MGPQRDPVFFIVNLKQDYLMHIKKTALLWIALTFIHPAFADDTEVSLKEAKALLERASNGKITALSVFEGPNELTGVVMQSPTGKGIAWIPSDGKNIMVGIFMDDDGKNLSLEAHQKYIGAFDSQPGSDANVIGKHGLISLIDGLPSVSLGNAEAKNTLYVFGDVNCHFCEDLHRLLKDADLSEVAVKWIPVAVLGSKSLDQAATLLSLPPDTQVELLNNHHGPTHKAIEPMDHQHAQYTELKKSIEKSGAVLAKLGTGTPLLAYWNGASVDIIPKSPTKSELTAALEKIKPLH
jgi:hypothetical protein